MSIIGNSLIAGGNENATFFAIEVGGTNNSSLQNLVNTTMMSEEDYFIISNANFICQKAGTYNMAYGVKGCYSSGGVLINGTVYIYRNGSSILSKGSNSTGWATGSSQVSLNIGDTITVKGKNSSGSNIEPIYFCIYEA